MDTIKLTPEVCQKHYGSDKPCKITIGKSMVSINPAAAKLLSLKKGEYIMLEVRDKKLYVRFDSNKEGIEIKNEGNSGTLNAYQKGIGLAIKYYGFEPEQGARSVSFTLGEFSEGLRELKRISKKDKKPNKEASSSLNELADML